MGAQDKAEEKIQRVLRKLSGERVDELASDGKGHDSTEFKHVAEAVMAWYQLLLASGIVRKDEEAIETLSSSLLVLGTLVMYAYALGVRRGRRQAKRG